MDVYEKPFTNFPNDQVEAIKKYGFATWPGFLVTKETDREVRSDGTGGRTCRESFIEAINKLILTQKDYLTDKLRFGVFLNNNSVAKIGDALKVLALYEKFAGFLPTEIFKMNIDKNSSQFSTLGANTFYVVASRRWFKSSYMLSLYLLLFRVAVRSAGFEDKDFASIETFEKKVRSLISQRNNDVLSDYETCSSTIRNWQKILKHYQELFGKKTIVKNWTSKEWGAERSLGDNVGAFRYEGISRLTSGTSQNESLRAKFNKLQ